MIKESDRQYYIRRAGEERMSAAQAADDFARRSHLGLADQLEKLADGGYFSISAEGASDSS